MRRCLCSSRPTLPLPCEPPGRRGGTRHAPAAAASREARATRSPRQAALAVVQQAKSSGNAVFSTTCLVHCLTCSSQDMTGYTANGEDVEQARGQPAAAMRVY